MSDWPTVPLGTLLTDIQPGFASGRHNSEGEGIPHFRPMNVSTDGHIERSVMKYVDPSAGRPDVRLSAGDILFNNTNSPELVGKTALFEDNDSPAFSNHMTRLRVDLDRLDPGYAALRLHQAWREGWFAAHCNNHVSQASIGRDVLKGFEIELPPLDVQHAMVSLNNTIDHSRKSASSHLSASQAAIERFREAVLAAACSGRLTADWRQENPESSANDVISAIRAARAGVPKAVDPEELPLSDGNEVPDSWATVRFGSVIGELRNGASPAPAMEPPGIPILRISAARPQRVDLDDVRYLRDDASKWAHSSLREGDLLFTRYNGSLSLLGVCGLVRGLGDRTILYPDKLMRVRFDHAFVEPEFVEIFFASPSARTRMTAGSVSSAGQQGVSGATVKAQPLVIPPLEEQREIVNRVSELFALADNVTTRIDAASHRVDRSSQAILAKAFQGKLLA